MFCTWLYCSVSRFHSSGLWPSYPSPSYHCGSDSKESAWNAADAGSIPGSGRSPGEGNGNPLQCSCLTNSTDRGAWWAIQSMGSQRVGQYSPWGLKESDMTEWLTVLPLPWSLSNIVLGEFLFSDLFFFPSDLLKDQFSFWESAKLPHVMLSILYHWRELTVILKSHSTQLTNFQTTIEGDGGTLSTWSVRKWWGFSVPLPSHLTPGTRRSCRLRTFSSSRNNFL